MTCRVVYHAAFFLVLSQAPCHPLLQDGTSFLHVSWWQNPTNTTTWLSVGLLVADSLEQARATNNITVGSMPTRAVGSLPGSSKGIPRRLLQQDKGLDPNPASSLNYVLGADNATTVPLLKSFGSISTTTPLLVYVTANITVSSATGVSARGIAINRFLHWVGLSSRNTSVDWHMEVSSCSWRLWPSWLQSWMKSMVICLLLFSYVGHGCVIYALC